MSTKLVKRNVKESSWISAGTSVHDSFTVTVTKARQVNKLSCCSLTS